MNSKAKVVGLIATLILIWVVIFIQLTGGISLGGKKNDSSVEDEDAVLEENWTPYELEFRLENYFVPGSQSTRNTVLMTNEDNQAVADTISNYLRGISNNEWDNVIIKKADQLSSSEPDTDNLGVNYFFSEGVQTGGRITVKSELIGSFGESPLTAYRGYNFDAKTGKVLDVNDLGTNVLGKLVDYCYDYLESLDKEYANDWQSRVVNEISTIGNWYFTENGIHVVFQINTIGDASLGVIQVDVPFGEFNDDLKTNYKFVLTQ